MKKALLLILVLALTAAGCAPAAAPGDGEAPEDGYRGLPLGVPSLIGAALLALAWYLNKRDQKKK